MNENILRTYKFYDRNNNRYGIFGEYDPRHKGLRIYTIMCSKNDQFSKEVAKAFYLTARLTRPSVPGCAHEWCFVACDKDQSQNAFIEFCEKNFYRKGHNTVYGTNMGVEIAYLTNDTEVIILPSEVIKVKAVPYPMD